MKIVIFTDLFLPHMDGVALSTVNLVKSLVDKGHNVTVVAPRIRGWKKVAMKGVKLLFLPSISVPVYPDFRLGLLSLSLIRYLNKIDADVFHVLTPGTVGASGRVLGGVFKKPLVGTFHGYPMDFVRLSVGEKQVKKMMWRLVQSFYEACDVVTTPSGFVKRDLVKRGLKKRIVVLPNLIELKTFVFDKGRESDLREKFLLENSQVVLSVGRVSREKSLDVLIKALDLLVKKGLDVKLLIVGEGPDKARLESLVGELQLGKKVVFAGEIENKKLLSSGIYKMADVFAMVGSGEVQPMVILEAMTFGLPIVGVKAGGLPELIGKNGLLGRVDNVEDLSENLSNILENKELRERMGRESKKISKNYSAGAVVSKLERLYKNLL